MHPQLELLLEIQDLRMQRRSLADGSMSKLEADVFDVRIEDAVGALDEKIEELEGRLDRGVRDRYDRISGKDAKVVAPVLNGICYGCFVALSTARASEADRNLRVGSCESCGCFHYHPR